LRDAKTRAAKREQQAGEQRARDNEQKGKKEKKNETLPKKGRRVRMKRDNPHRSKETGPFFPKGEKEKRTRETTAICFTLAAFN